MDPKYRDFSVDSLEYAASKGNRHKHKLMAWAAGQLRAYAAKVETVIPPVDTPKSLQRKQD